MLYAKFKQIGDDWVLMRIEFFLTLKKMISWINYFSSKNEYTHFFSELLSLETFYNIKVI